MNNGIKLAAAIAACAISAAAAATTITFDDVVVSGNPILTAATSSGFDFNGIHFHVVDSPGSCNCVQDGTQYLASEEANNLGRPVVMTDAGGAPFALTSFRGGEVFVGGDVFYLIHLVGQYAAGGSITADFILDGIRDGAGGVDDFQTFVLGAGWTNLASVTFSGISAAGGLGSFSLDDIVVNGSAVPEPGTLALAGLAMAGLAWRRRRS